MLKEYQQPTSPIAETFVGEEKTLSGTTLTGLGDIAVRPSIVEYVLTQKQEDEAQGLVQRARQVLGSIAQRVWKPKSRESTPPFPRKVQFENEISMKTWVGKADEQWGAVTSVATRLIKKNPDIRRTLISFVAEPLHEEMPQEMVKRLTELEPRMARIVGRAANANALLKLPAIPKEAISPDIKHAPPMLNTDILANRPTTEKETSPAEYAALLAQTAARAKVGMTAGEKILAITRYRYARDAKLLGFMAEIHETPPTMVEDGDTYSAELPSGVKVVMTGDAYNADPDLLDPAGWDKRKQIKDRVYRIWTGGKTHILKERKTSLHGDTKKGGHVDGNTSEQEFTIGRRFSGLGVIRQDDIELTWERPKGYVTFPDGYQFCIFEDDATIDSALRKGDIQNIIHENRTSYEDEYAEVKIAAKSIAQKRPDLTRDWLSEGQEQDISGKDLTFDEFAALKEHYMQVEAEEYLDDVVRGLGIARNDDYNYGLTVRVEGGRAVLRVANFDVEYYMPNAEAAAGGLRHKRQSQAEGQYAQQRVYSPYGSGGLFRAASYALMQRMGWSLPEPNTGYL